jgi:hypothetical protein
MLIILLCITCTLFGVLIGVAIMGWIAVAKEEDRHAEQASKYVSWDDRTA